MILQRNNLFEGTCDLRRKATGATAAFAMDIPGHAAPGVLPKPRRCADSLAQSCPEISTFAPSWPGAKCGLCGMAMHVGSRWTLFPFPTPRRLLAAAGGKRDTTIQVRTCDTMQTDRVHSYVLYWYPRVHPAPGARICHGEVSFQPSNLPACTLAPWVLSLRVLDMRNANDDRGNANADHMLIAEEEHCLESAVVGS